MLWVLKRTVSMRRLFWTHKTHILTDGDENNPNFTHKIIPTWTHPDHILRFHLLAPSPVCVERSVLISSNYILYIIENKDVCYAI